MKKHTSNLNSLILRLTDVWLLWMQNHNISNNPSFENKIRRNAGQKCEELQIERNEIISKINDLWRTK